MRFCKSSATCKGGLTEQNRRSTAAIHWNWWLLFRLLISQDGLMVSVISPRLFSTFLTAFFLSGQRMFCFFLDSPCVDRTTEHEATWTVLVWLFPPVFPLNLTLIQCRTSCWELNSAPVCPCRHSFVSNEAIAMVALLFTWRMRVREKQREGERKRGSGGKKKIKNP